ncbi:MAG: leucine-rich repeat domain-containing protein [Bacteroidales bacterium]|nr:leucine-rich repeat domain-containing protein [Bacteroidales bacterium]
MKIKNLISIFVVLMLLASTASAQTSGSCGENATWSFDTESQTLTISGTGAMADYNSSTMPWNDIKDNIQSVVINQGITSIGKYAFYGCANLNSVIIPDGVTTISGYAFRSCSNLTTVTIPASITSMGFWAFAGCKRLVLTIPDGVTGIDKLAFENVANIIYKGSATENSPWGAKTLNGCVDGDFVYKDDSHKTLTAYIGNGGDVEIPQGVSTIGESAFAGIDITSVTIPSSVTAIERYAFHTCKSLRTVTIPNSVTSIGLNAFANVKHIIYYGNANDPNREDFWYWGAQTLNGFVDGDFVYEDDSKTKLMMYLGKGGNVEISTSVTVINDYTFSNCTTLTSVSIPNSVTNIGNGALYGCTGLEYVTIPNSVTNIGTYAFYKVPQIFYYGTATGSPWGALNLNGEEWLYEDDAHTIIKQYMGAGGDVSIPDGVTAIAGSAFAGCTSLTSVSIPDGVTTIDGSAFAGCTSLTSVSIPDGVTTIGGSAFKGCTSLTSVTIPESVAEIKDWAFDDCQSVTDVYCYAKFDKIRITTMYSYFNTDTKFHVFVDELDKWNEGYKNIKYTFVGDIKRMSDESITIPAQTYTGSALTPVVKDGEKTLVEGMDYIITLPEGGCIIPGEYTVTLAGKNPLYYKSAEKTFTITAKTLVSSNIADIAALTYTGSAFEPEVTVTDGTKTLAEGTDYTVEYSNNTNAGTSAKATITGKGNYTGMVEKTFTINAKTLVASNVSNIAAQTYTGSAIEPDIDVTDGKTTLVKGVDFTVTCSENINVGTATAIITGKGNYAGTIEKTFTITQATPTYTIPENLSLKCNQTLADITLPKGLVFDDIKAALTLGKTNTVTATFTPEDTKNYVVVKNIDIKVAVTDHVHAEAVKENEVAATTENAGKYDEVVYCSVCHKELSRTPKTTPQLTHDNPNNQDNPSTPVLSISDNPVVKVWSFNHTIYIETLPDTEYKIIDLNGRVITTSKTKSTNEQIKINKSGILIVIIDNQSFKLSL